MQCLVDVYEKIQNEKIEVFTRSMKPCDAATVEVEGEYGIFIDRKKITNKQDEFMALSHEYGHCKSGATHKLYSPYQLIGQHENRANRAAVHEILPYERLINAVNKGNTEVWQLAEYLDMPEQFIKMAIDLYETERY